MWRRLKHTCFDHADAFFQPHTEVGYYLAPGAHDAATGWLYGLRGPGTLIHKDIVDWYFPVEDDPALASFRVRRERVHGHAMWVAIACLAPRRYQRVMVRLHAEDVLGPDVLARTSEALDSAPTVRIEKARDIVFLKPFQSRCGGRLMSDYASVALDRITAVHVNDSAIAVRNGSIIEFEYAGTGRAQGLETTHAFADWATAGQVRISEKTRRKFDEFAAPAGR